jgi:hypothetical protein
MNWGHPIRPTTTNCPSEPNSMGLGGIIKLVHVAELKRQKAMKFAAMCQKIIHQCITGAKEEGPQQVNGRPSL